MVDDEQFLLVQMLRESIQQGITPSLTVISDSMSPLLRQGDKVGLRKLPPEQAEPGQIITFSKPHEGQSLITHRIAGVVLDNGEEKLATFGDRSLLLDTPVNLEDVVGLVIWRQRGNHAINLMSGPGARLNKKLANRANKNLKMASGFEIGQQTALDSDKVLHSNKICRRQRKRLWKRLYFKSGYLWACLLTGYSDYLSRSSSGT